METLENLKFQLNEKEKELKELTNRLSDFVLHPEIKEVCLEIQRLKDKISEITGEEV